MTDFTSPDTMHSIAPADAAASCDAAQSLPPIKLAARGLDFWYDGFHAIKHIQLDIPEKHVTALIGPSGCGKSTLLRVFNRIYALYPKLRATGEVLLDGENILSDAYPMNRLRSKVGMVFQKPVPFPMTIHENVAYGIRHHERLSKADLEIRVEKALRQAALWDEVKDKLNEPGTSLSGGQQQRLCIARALAVNPDVILLDEPCSALDPIATARIEELLLEIRRDYTMVIVTHNMGQAQRVAEHTAFFLQGELVEFDTTAALFGSPRDPRTADYIAGRFG